MLIMRMACETFQAEMSWLKEEAPLNMLPIYPTEETFQAEMYWLKEEAPENMRPCW